MARETKNDRLVRGMYDQVLEHFHQLKTISANPNHKESDVERWCDGILRNCLGFTATNGYSIRSQETKGKGRPDLIVYQGEAPILVVEVKKLGFDFSRSDFRSGKVQLAEYMGTLGKVKWGILCNGYQWKLYDFSEPNTGGVESVSFDIRDEVGGIDTTKNSVEESCYDFADLHESCSKDGTWEEWSKEATAFSPDSLAKAILSLNSIKVIAKEIRGEFDYKVNHEILFDKVVDFLTQGLNDAIPDWNDSKQAEINKYVTSQKRQSRKKKSSKAKQEATDVASPVPSAPVVVQPAQKAVSAPDNAVPQPLETSKKVA